MYSGPIPSRLEIQRIDSPAGPMQQIHNPCGAEGESSGHGRWPRQWKADGSCTAFDPSELPRVPRGEGGPDNLFQAWAQVSNVEMH